ncbi:LacI family DNA-binding transcriptional regulator [Algibacter sp. PT7-4]|uniref:LacI family DNA-binding transcriptional regulator n=1 Tax=Algibacter ulvanivorans TaxID=3400999 RepID=UPI003AAAA077
MTKKYTIRDIAKMAGVSKGTVDRVIHKRGKVSEKALQKVTEVLEKIDYQPNVIAKNLKNNKIYNIYVLLPDPVKDPYWIPCTKGINNVILELGHFGVNITTTFFDPINPKSFLKANITIQNEMPDAVLLAPLFFKEANIVLAEYERLGIIVSTFNNDIESIGVKSFIGQDLFQSGRVAAKLLHSIGSNGDLAVINIEEQYENAIFMQEKEKGFKSYFSTKQNFNSNILLCNIKYSDFENVLTNFIKENPKLSGIFVTTSKAYLVAEIIKNINHKKINLVGYDLINENIKYLKEEVIDFLIHQNPMQQAYFGLKFLVEHFIFEKEIPNQLLLPLDIINSENFKLYKTN